MPADVAGELPRPKPTSALEDRNVQTGLREPARRDRTTEAAAYDDGIIGALP